MWCSLTITGRASGRRRKVLQFWEASVCLRPSTGSATWPIFATSFDNCWGTTFISIRGSWTVACGPWAFLLSRLRPLPCGEFESVSRYAAEFANRSRSWEPSRSKSPTLENRRAEHPAISMLLLQ